MRKFKKLSRIRKMSSRSSVKSTYRKSKYSSNQVRYIVVHSSLTKSDLLLSEVETLPYHFLITKGGKSLCLKSVSSKDGTVEVALIGGLDKEGNRVDCRSERQNAALLSRLIRLSKRYPTATIVSADMLYVYAYANPGFDLQHWLTNFTPASLH